MRGAFSLLWVVLVVFAPAALFYFAVPLSVVNVVYWISIVSISITNLAIFLELMLAPFWDRYIERSKAGPVDFGTRHIVAMVSAYLPNEIDILSDTIQRMIDADRPTEHTMLTVLVDHNGGKSEQVRRLESIVAGFNAELGPDSPVRVVEVENKASRSKAENINFALDYMARMQPPPEMVALYDADHQPAPDVFVLAAGRLESSGADVLQGRAIIHQGYPLIALEYEYGVGSRKGSPRVLGCSPCSSLLLNSRPNVTAALRPSSFAAEKYQRRRVYTVLTCRGHCNALAVVLSGLVSSTRSFGMAASCCAAGGFLVVPTATGALRCSPRLGWTRHASPRTLTRPSGRSGLAISSSTTAAYARTRRHHRRCTTCSDSVSAGPRAGGR